MIDGIIFDSKKESERWPVLLGLLREGKISCLQRQKIFRIKVNEIRVCNYVADFIYIEGGLLVVEDVKSPITRKLPVYVLKRKLMAAAFGIIIREV